jgi:RNA polymerase sigma factor (sigma-70 family)
VSELPALPALADRPPEPDFDRFAACTYPAILARAIMLCGHRQDAEDAVQEAYCEAFRRWDRIGGYDSAEGWVYMVMAQRLWRARRRWAKTLDAARDLPVPQGSRPDQVAAAHEVLRLLAGLPPARRLALVLHCLYGKSQREIAQELGVSRGTVAASIHQGRSALKKALAPALADVPDTQDLLTTAGNVRSGAAPWSGYPLTALLGAVAAQVERAVEADRAGCAALLARLGAGDDGDDDDDAPSGSAPC